MEDIKLEYSKDWRNPADFPTVEPDETKVREDLQLLYNEIQTFLNDRLIPIMKALEKPRIENLPVENEVSTSRDKIPTSYAVAQLFSSNGNLPTGGAAGQFLVKSSDAYADAAWATFKIPGRISDLVAIDENGNTVNAQALMTDLSSKIQATMTDVITPELLAEGLVNNGTVVDISSAGDYETLWITLSCDGRPTQTPAAVYLGAWNGQWLPSGDEVSVLDESGMLPLAHAVFAEDSRSQISSELTLLPYRGGHLIRYQQGMRAENACYCDGLYLCFASASEVPDQTKLTLFSDMTNSGTGVDSTPVSYQVFGIKRRTKAEVK